MITQKPRSIKTVIDLVNNNPGQWWPKYLEALGGADTHDAYLLLQAIIDDLHPTAAAQCCRISTRRTGLYCQSH
jgi:hypothetical protein